MHKRLTLLILSVVFFAAVVPAQEFPSFVDMPGDTSSIEEPSIENIIWYRSNSSGMALELIPSRRAALRNEYSLAVETIDPWRLPGELPAILSPYYDPSYRIELRTLYEEGEEYRRQWIFRDQRGLVRITASGSPSLFGGEIGFEIGLENSADEPKTGFIEIRDSEGSVVQETRFNEDLSELEFRFFYTDNVLLRTETWFRNQEESPDFILASTDTFRYTRSGSLRAIDRVLHEGAGYGSLTSRERSTIESPAIAGSSRERPPAESPETESPTIQSPTIERSSVADASRTRVEFPGIGPDLSPVNELISHGSVHTSEFLSDIYFPAGSRASYNLDSRGRILSEVWRNEDGGLLGEFRNAWSDDRLLSISWKSDDDERLVEYEYDREGNRITERNTRQGSLERSVTRQGDIDIEDIYINGRLVLRAHWEKGLKISEERISSAGERPR